MDNVTVSRRGERAVGTLHLTPHHLVFSHTPPTPEGAPEDKPVKPRELWITYPIISYCTFRPASSASRQPASIRLRCRDFTFVCFTFENDKTTNIRDVYETIRSWTCKLGRIDKLYAFSYVPPQAERVFNGWDIYDARKEWNRLGVGNPDSKCNWRISGMNADYSVSSSPKSLCIVAGN